MRCVGHSKGTGYRANLHPPYSPDLAIRDFGLFLNFKNRPHGQKYKPREQLRCSVNRNLLEMSHDSLQHVIRSWVEWWNKCNLCQED